MSSQNPQPLVSTVITSFNKGEFLVATLDSALAQTYPAQEIIVIDDGSTDDTAEVVKRYGDRVRYIYQTNKGQCSAKNRGVAEAKGEFVAFLDGDDMWRPTKLEKQMALFAQKPHLGLVFTDRLKFQDDKIVWASNWIKHPPYRGWVLDKVLVDNFIPFSAVVAKKSCVLEVGGFDLETPVAPDYDLWLRMTRLYEVDYVDEVLMEYRLSSNSIGGRISSKFQHVTRIQQRFVERFYNGNYPKPEIVAKATSLKYVTLGDHHLSQGRNRQAAIAYLNAIRWEPTRLRRYVHLVRALTPNRLAKVVKVMLPKSLKEKGS